MILMWVPVPALIAFGQQLMMHSWILITMLPWVVWSVAAVVLAQWTRQGHQFLKSWTVSRHG